ncbi:wax ester/triacylglycerol synthase domain-containing protein [Sphingomonas sanxanigenens]|uniref:Uncharacterized protein n=1 Tax=Sphingomonas sanxanigenens DSM 19645 = NX02 TaxID=1123269 RepID=W0AD56_9SPHN|nr:wax ester/triacylglycerol synthase domain-containing protein [Sphingomonas sanxanigenens]AHE55844.1 hypothetical protein NX02_21015 [Sphingomonas sanxanigenens DSM 19645 = NX02]
MQQLGVEDARFVYHDAPATPMHVGLLCLYDPASAADGRVRFKHILRHVAARLRRAAAFRRRLVRVPLDLDAPYWIEDPDFDVEHHVRHIALPQPGDWRQLCILASRLHARPMDLNRPLWEFTIIEGLDGVAGLPPGAFALFAKTHLAAIDPVAGDRMLAAVHDPLPAGFDDDGSSDGWQPDSHPGIRDLLVSSYFNTLRKPFQFAETLARALPDLARRGAQRIARRGEPAPAPVEVPPTPFAGAVGPHRVYDAVTLPLAEIVRIEAVSGATRDAVIGAIVGGAIAQYLDARGALPHAPLAALLPAGNGAIALPLATDADEDGARLRLIMRKLDRDPVEPLPAATTFGPALAGQRARQQLRRLADADAPPVATALASFPGIDGDVYFGGARLLAVHALVPLADDLGLAHTATAQGGTLVIGFTADRAKLPDPATYAAALAASAERLGRAVTMAPPARRSTDATRETPTATGGPAATGGMAIHRNKEPANG